MVKNYKPSRKEILDYSEFLRASFKCWKERGPNKAKLEKMAEECLVRLHDNEYKHDMAEKVRKSITALYEEGYVSQEMLKRKVNI